MSVDDTTAGAQPRLAREKIALLPHLRDLALISVIGWALQLLATDLTPLAALGGMAGLYAICVGGLLLARVAPFYLPSVAWISLLGIAATVPFAPWDQAVLGVVEEIDFLALSVPCLAYAGLAVSGDEVAIAKRTGWKLAVIAVFVLAGTYFGSAVIADIVLTITD
ncbi:hypothetical protein [Phytoactinopolyspora halotolerans]|uniref:Uncharacterized protein n=1 Tax=Phytoactinopolyspora halotolerans TaxID=1981512 RepID=A0A6L9SEA8_9ACTN|nr:hypothetical protein [Phytoactinopolyspora halotolerans]NEE03379.1 hypothetical protein [Phytoactinopolyspora halotolerans]